ncbi:MAG: hypothetical protein LBU42_08070 [Prevotellaceae bacterium]|jgi:hypothetical protein|nr:hypothetical protein [Prevotellaceae bacterium]
MQVKRSVTQHGDAHRYFLHARGARVFRYARTVRRAKGSGGLLPQAALRLPAVMKIRRFTPFLMKNGLTPKPPYKKKIQK